MWDFVSGWGAGMVGITVGYPFDTVKVNQQTQGLGTFRCTQVIYQQFGIKGFFRGLSFPLAASGVLNSIYFGVYRLSLNGLLELQSRCTDSHSQQLRARPHFNVISKTSPHLFYILSGSAAGLCQGLVLCPVELVKIKLQTVTVPHCPAPPSAACAVSMSSLKPLGPIAVLREIVDTQGIQGMYKGLTPTLWRTIPGAAVYMLTYENLSRWTRTQTSNWSTSKGVQIGGVFAAGGISGMIAWWAVMPFDTIKSIIQADDTRNPKYRGMAHCARVVWKEQGLTGFGRGFWAVGIRAFPVNGSIFLTLEGCNYLFREVLKL